MWAIIVSVSKEKERLNHERNHLQYELCDHYIEVI